MRAPTIITFAISKGGVSKTTSCRFTGFFLSQQGYKVLLIDTDNQANLTKGLIEEYHIKGLYEALEENSIHIQQIRENLHLLAGSFKLSLLEKRYVGELDAYTKLKDLLSKDSFKDFDYILIDTNSSLSILTLNALVSSKHYIIPVRPAFYSLQGINDLLAVVGKIKKNFNPSLSLLGIIVNEYNSRAIIRRQILEEIQSAFGDALFQTTLSKSIRVEEAIDKKKGIIELPKSKIKEQIISIGNELLKRVGK